jgi:hypothetical protein
MDRLEDVLTLGYFDGQTVKEIATGDLSEFLTPLQEVVAIRPTVKNLEALDLDYPPNTLVRVENVQLIEAHWGKAYANYSGGADAYRLLETCGEAQKISLYTSGAADFAQEPFPLGIGTVTGVLSHQDQQLQLQIRTLDDVLISETTAPCPSIDPRVLLTEIADPVNRYQARFVELYNAGDHAIDLGGWTLNKYLNGSSKTASGAVELSGILEPNAYRVVANTGFVSAFGSAPDWTSSYISGTGDDVYDLRDASGHVQDVFGQVGVDGSGTAWEYTDGKAVRKVAIDRPNPVFDLSEWTLFSKVKGTEQQAPEDFNPWVR